MGKSAKGKREAVERLGWMGRAAGAGGARACRACPVASQSPGRPRPSLLSSSSRVALGRAFTPSRVWVGGSRLQLTIQAFQGPYSVGDTTCLPAALVLIARRNCQPFTTRYPAYQPRPTEFQDCRRAMLTRPAQSARGTRGPLVPGTRPPLPGSPGK